MLHLLQDEVGPDESRAASDQNCLFHARRGGIGAMRAAALFTNHGLDCNKKGRD
jgi:hypothetical protein